MEVITIIIFINLVQYSIFKILFRLLFFVFKYFFTQILSRLTNIFYSLSGALHDSSNATNDRRLLSRIPHCFNSLSCSFHSSSQNVSPSFSQSFEKIHLFSFYFVFLLPSSLLLLNVVVQLKLH
uniref:Uncharacterized protein n=1 Tax=Cucumis sativus TaxID=3659 RepID=A0A0A0KA19_CUCSA